MVKKFIAIFLLVTLFWIQQVQAQNDSLPAPSFSGALWRSAMVPGWGQVYQERLWQGIVLYGSSAVFAYRTLFHAYHYHRNGGEKHRRLFTVNLTVSLYLYGLNLLDVIDAGLHEHPRGWQGTLMSDRPLKSPWGAVVRSAILPGWGQVYVESYWKALGYFLADGFLAFQVHRYNQLYRETGDKSYREERSRYSWYLGLAYLMTMADAYAGAYLYRFNDAIKLTWSVLNEQTLGFVFTYTF